MLLSKSVTTNIASKAIGATRSMSKEIKFGVEGRAAMLKGVNLLADAVQVCLLYTVLYFLCESLNQMIMLRYCSFSLKEASAPCNIYSTLLTGSISEVLIFLSFFSI